jgi:hypothetical protein
MSTENDAPADPIRHPEPEPYRMRLPGFLGEREIGLGDVIHRVTNAIGIPTCSSCERRRAALNRRVAFTGR